MSPTWPARNTSLEPLAMERRLREAPLTQPEGVLTRQESVAETFPEAIVERTLVVVPGVVLQDMLDIGGIRREESVVRAGLQVDEVAIAIRRVKKRSDGIRPQLREYAENRIPARSGRKCR